MLEIIIIIAIIINTTRQPASFLCFSPFLTSQPLPFAVNPLHPAFCLLSLLSPSPTRWAINNFPCWDGQRPQFILRHMNQMHAWCYMPLQHYESVLNGIGVNVENQYTYFSPLTGGSEPRGKWQWIANMW